MNKIASLDIEICDELESPSENYVPRISCAAVAFSDVEVFGEPLVRYWTSDPDRPDMSPEQVQRMIEDLIALQVEGYTFLTWNGVSFDWKVIEHFADYLAPSVRQLSWEHHIDMMLLVTFQRGHRLSLDSALSGHRLSSKLHSVTLSNGTEIHDMSGAKAPELWKLGERKAVLEYLAVDVIQPLKLAEEIERGGLLKWVSKTSGKLSVVNTKLLTVKDAYHQLPLPNDVSWMTQPIHRSDYIAKYLPEFVS